MFGYDGYMHKNQLFASGKGFLGGRGAILPRYALYKLGPSCAIIRIYRFSAYRIHN